MAPAPAAGPLTAAIHRLWQIANAANDRVEAVFERLAQVRPGVARRKGAIGEVGPGAKASPRAGNENGPAFGVRPSALNSRGQSFNEGGVERVETLGPVEGERQHARLEPIQKSRLR